jgi:DNA-binding response OmpR family regulator
MMPKLDGYGFLKIHSSSSNSAIPVVLLTAKTEEGDELIGKELGAKEYVKKPFTFQELRKIVEKYI